MNAVAGVRHDGSAVHGAHLVAPAVTVTIPVATIAIPSPATIPATTPFPIAIPVAAAALVGGNLRTALALVSGHFEALHMVIEHGLQEDLLAIAALELVERIAFLDREDVDDVRMRLHE